MSTKLYATVIIDVATLDEDVVEDARTACEERGYPVTDENVAYFALENILNAPGLRGEVTG